MLGTVTQGFPFASFRVHPGLLLGFSVRERFRGVRGARGARVLVEKTNAAPSTPLKSASLRMTELEILLRMTELEILLGMTELENLAWDETA
jgi:hypothetical protein